MTALCGSLESISSVNVPVMTSYVPTDPKVAPLKAGWLSLICQRRHGRELENNRLTYPTVAAGDDIDLAL